MPRFSYQHVFEPATDPDAPPLLLLHGPSGSELEMLRIGRSLSPGSALLSPRGNVHEPGAVRFFERIAKGVYNPQEVSRRSQAMADFVISAAKYYGLDLNRLVAIGSSNGANVAASLLLLRPETLGAAVLFRPSFVLDLPAAPDSLVGKRILMTHGTTDPLVPAGDPQRLAELFRAGGAEVIQRLHTASHALVQADIEVAREFLAIERSRLSVHR